MASFPAATPHGAIEEVFPEVFRVRGCIAGRGMKFSRNMTIVRHGDALTVINSMRLSDEGEAALAELGRVEHLVKLGAFHGLDDPYYVDRYRPTLWALPGATHKGELATDRELGDESPIEGATVFSFRTTAEPEAAIVIGAGGGTLLTCDAVTNLVDLDGSEGCEGIITAEHGFLRRASIGLFWRNRMRKESGGAPLVHDYQRLLELPWVNLLSAHGPPLLGTAKTDLIETLRYLYKVEIELREE